MRMQRRRYLHEKILSLVALVEVPTYVRVTVTVVYITIVRVFLPLEGTISVGCELRAAIYVIREKVWPSVGTIIEYVRTYVLMFTESAAVDMAIVG